MGRTTTSLSTSTRSAPTSRRSRSSIRLPAGTHSRCRSSATPDPGRTSSVSDLRRRRNRIPAESRSAASGSYSRPGSSSGIQLPTRIASSPRIRRRQDVVVPSGRRQASGAEHRHHLDAAPWCRRPGPALDSAAASSPCETCGGRLVPRRWACRMAVLVPRPEAWLSRAEPDLRSSLDRDRRLANTRECPGRLARERLRARAWKPCRRCSVPRSVTREVRDPASRSARLP